MSQETVPQSPALTASQNSWRCVHAKDKEGWLVLMADAVVIEDPIGPAYTNPDARGVQGKEGASSFWDNSIGLATIRITCEETFPSSSPDEIAHILQLRTSFDNGSASAVRGIFTYKVNDAGLLTNLRGYWNMDMMKPVQARAISVNALTLAIAAELKEHGVRANVVCPGAKTRLSTGPDYEAHIVGLNRRGLLDEVSTQAALDVPPAEYVVTTYAYLASDLAKDMTGQIFIAAGGFVGRFDRPSPSLLGYRDHHDSPPWSVDDIHAMVTR